MTEQSDVVSKSRFAMLCGVLPGRVTQWILEGKIDASAQSGSGCSAKIAVSSYKGSAMSGESALFRGRCRD